jgi:hypothetical protein
MNKRAKNVIVPYIEIKYIRLIMRGYPHILIVFGAMIRWIFVGFNKKKLKNILVNLRQ